MTGEYLPPLVTELRGDNASLLAAAAEAEAAMKAFGKTSSKTNDEVGSGFRKSGREIDDFTDLVVRRMRKGETAVQVLRRELKRTGDEVEQLRKRLAKDSANQGLYADFKRAGDELARIRKLAKGIAPELLAAGKTFGQKIGVEFSGMFAGIGELLMPALIGAVVLALPVISALIGSAVAVGLGLGFAGLGAFLAAMFNSKVKRLFGELGTSLKRQVGLAVTGAFDDSLVVALRNFKAWVPIFGKELKSIFDSLAPLLPGLFDAVGGGISELLIGIGNAVKQLSTNGTLQTFIDTIPMVFQAVGDFLVAITRDGPALSRFIYDAANAISRFLEGAGEVISWLTRTYDWLVRLNDKVEFFGGWQRRLEGLKITLAAIGAFFVMLWGKITDGAKAVGSWFANLGQTIWAWLKDAGAAVADWFTTTVAWFKALPGRVVGFLASMPGRVTAVVKRMAHQAAYWVGWLVGRWFKFVTEAPGKIVAAVGRAWLWIREKFAQGVTASVEFLRALPGKVAEYFSYVWSAATTWVSKTWKSVTDWFARTKQSMIEHIASAITSVVGFFKGLPGKAAEQGKAFKDRLIGFFKGAKDWLFESGKDIVRGIIDGVKSMWNWAVEKVKSFAHDIWKGFRDALGISSPSKVFADLARWIPEGVAQGVDRHAYKAADAVDRMFAGARPGSAYAGSVTPAMAATIGSGPSGAVYRGPSMVATDVYIAGRKVLAAITPVAQRTKARSGVTGLA